MIVSTERSATPSQNPCLRSLTQEGDARQDPPELAADIGNGHRPDGGGALLHGSTRLQHETGMRWSSHDPLHQLPSVRPVSASWSAEGRAVLSKRRTLTNRELALGTGRSRFTLVLLILTSVTNSRWISRPGAVEGLRDGVPASSARPRCSTRLRPMGDAWNGVALQRRRKENDQLRRDRLRPRQHAAAGRRSARRRSPTSTDLAVDALRCRRATSRAPDDFDTLELTGPRRTASCVIMRRSSPVRTGRSYHRRGEDVPSSSCSERSGCRRRHPFVRAAGDELILAPATFRAAGDRRRHWAEGQSRRHL